MTTEPVAGVDTTSIRDRPTTDATGSGPGGSQPSVARRLAGGVGWRTIVVGAGVVSGLVGAAAAARILSASGFASFLVANSAFMIAPALAQFGLSRNAVLRIAELNATGRRDEARRYSHSILHGVAVVSPVGCVLTALFVLLTRPEDPVQIVSFLAISLLLETLRLAAGDVLLGHERQGWSAVAAYQPRVVLQAVIFGAIAFNHSDVSLATVQLIILGIQVVLTLIVLPPVRTYLAAPRSDEMQLRRLIREGLPFLMIDGGSFILGRADLWIAAAVLTASMDRAAYGAASTIAVQITLPVMIPMIVMSPIVRSLWIERRLDELRHLVRGIATLASVLALAGFVVMAVWGSQILGFVYGPGYEIGASWLTILMLGSLGAVITGASGVVHVMCVGPVEAAVVNGAWGVGGATLMIVAATVGGGTGLALASAFTISGLNLTQVYLVWRRADINTLPTFRPRQALSAIRGRRALRPAA